MKTSSLLLAAKIVACVALGLAAADCQKAAEAPAPAASQPDSKAADADAAAPEARQQPSEPAADTLSPSNAPPPPPAH